MNIIVNNLKKLTHNQIILCTILILFFAISVLFVNNNASFYKDPVAEVIKTDIVKKNNVTDRFQNKDSLFTQKITAQLKSGKEKGEFIRLKNKYSASGVYDQAYHVGNELFVSINKNEDKKLTGSIIGVKRDKYVLIIAWLFIFLLLLVGRMQGFFSTISLAVNASLMFFALDVYVNHSTISLLWICGIAVVLFTFVSLLLINGLNEKAFTAAITTLLGTFSSLLITYLVMWLTSEKGLRYEEMQFLTRPYHMVFMAGLFVGSLGAIMDVAITISSSLFGLYEKDHDISITALKSSGMEIGKDVMGTLTNVLFFVYISGSIPMIILYLKNASLLDFTLSMNLSLELARALAGGIGIVITIPIGIYTSILFINRKRKRL